MRYHKDNFGSVDLCCIQHTFLDTLSVQYCACVCLHGSRDIFDVFKNLELNIGTEVTLKTWLVPVQESAFQISWEVVHKDANWAHMASSRVKSMWAGESGDVNPDVHSHCLDTVYTKL